MKTLLSLLTVLAFYASQAQATTVGIRFGGHAGHTSAEALANLSAARQADVAAFPTFDQWVSTSIGNDANPGSMVLPKQTLGAAVSECQAAGATETNICSIHLSSEYFPFCGTFTSALNIRGVQTYGTFADKATHVYCNTGSPAPLQVNLGSVGGDIYFGDFDDLDPSGNASGVTVTSQLSTSQGFSELNLSGVAFLGPANWPGVGANNDFLEVGDHSSLRGGGTLDSIGIDYQYSNLRGTWTFGDTAGNGGLYFGAIFSNMTNSNQTFTSTTGAIQASYQVGFSGNATVSISGTGAGIFYDSPSSKPGTLAVTGGAIDGSPQTVVANGGTATISNNGNAQLVLNDTSGSSNNTLMFQNNGTNVFSLFSGNGGYFSFYDNTTSLAYLTLDATDDLTINNLSSSLSSALTVNQNANVGPAAPAVVINDNEAINFPNLELNDTSGSGFASLYFANSGTGGVTIGQGSSFGQLFSFFDNTANAAAMWFDLSDNSIFQNVAASTSPAMTVTQNSTTVGTALALNVSSGSPTGAANPAFNVFGPNGGTLQFYDTGSFGGMGMSWSGTPVWYADGNFGGELVFPTVGLQVSFAAPVAFASPVTFASVLNLTPQALGVTPSSPIAGQVALTSTGTLCVYIATVWVDVTPTHAACTF